MLANLNHLTHNHACLFYAIQDEFGPSVRKYNQTLNERLFGMLPEARKDYLQAIEGLHWVEISRQEITDAVNGPLGLRDPHPDIAKKISESYSLEDVPGPFWIAIPPDYKGNIKGKLDLLVHQQLVGISNYAKSLNGLNKPVGSKF